MRLSVCSIISLCAVSSLAQVTGPNNISTPTAIDGEITVHYVTVGEQQNQFVPNSIVAKPGDIVSFQFWPDNHSVIQSLYGWPCVPKNDVEPDEPIFFSGIFPVSNPTTENLNNRTWNLTINDTSPIFYYCGAPGSCINWGMLGVINANSETSLVTQLDIARNESFMIEPGTSLSPSASASLGAIAAAATAVNTTVPATSNSKHPLLSSGAIAGIAVGGAAVLILAGALLFILGRNKSLRTALQQEHSRNQPEAAFSTPLSPPPLYQQFSVFPPEAEHKDGVTVQEAPTDRPYSRYSSYHDDTRRPHMSRSRFSELSAETPSTLHEMFVPLASRLEENQPDGRTSPRTYT